MSALQTQHQAEEQNIRRSNMQVKQATKYSPPNIVEEKTAACCTISFKYCLPV